MASPSFFLPATRHPADGATNDNDDEDDVDDNVDDDDDGHDHDEDHQPSALSA